MDDNVLSGSGSIVNSIDTNSSCLLVLLNCLPGCASWFSPSSFALSATHNEAVGLAVSVHRFMDSILCHTVGTGDSWIGVSIATGQWAGGVQHWWFIALKSRGDQDRMRAVCGECKEQGYVSSFPLSQLLIDFSFTNSPRWTMNGLNAAFLPSSSSVKLRNHTF